MEIVENKYENLSLCAECGGNCCKNTGCGYLPQDFENMNFETLKNKVDGGNISITARFAPYSKNGIIISANPILFLKERNEGRGIIDIFSMGRPCASLTDKGCSHPFESRPSDGKNLIPGKNRCESIYPFENQLEDWSKFQKVMQRLYRNYAKHSLDDQIKIDVINVKKEIEAKSPYVKKMDYSELEAYKQAKSTIEFLAQLGLYQTEEKKEDIVLNEFQKILKLNLF